MESFLSFNVWYLFRPFLKLFNLLCFFLSYWQDKNGSLYKEKYKDIIYLSFRFCCGNTHFLSMDWILSLCLTEISWVWIQRCPTYPSWNWGGKNSSPWRPALFLVGSRNRRRANEMPKSLFLTLHHFISAHITLVRASHAGNAEVNVGQRCIVLL